jgi:predicted NodU family carbamoyl transferase
LNILGISAGFHDAAATVINSHGDILFAGHSERYSKIKNDPNLGRGLIDELVQYNIHHVAYYETPWKNSVSVPASKLCLFVRGRLTVIKKQSMSHILLSNICPSQRRPPAPFLSTLILICVHVHMYNTNT